MKKCGAGSDSEWKTCCFAAHITYSLFTITSYLLCMCLEDNGLLFVRISGMLNITAVDAVFFTDKYRVS